MIALILAVIAVTAFAICSSYFLYKIISTILIIAIFMWSLVLILLTFSVLFIFVLFEFLKSLASIFFLIF